MPDKWAQYAATPQPTEDKWAQYAKGPSPEAPISLMPGTANSDAAGRFAHGIANTMNPVPGIQAIANDPQGLKHGIEEGIFAPQAEQFHKASDAIHGRGEFGSMGTVGRISSAAGHAAAGALPLVGPTAANAGDKIGEGDVAGGLGEAAGLGLSAVTPQITKGHRQGPDAGCGAGRGKRTRHPQRRQSGSEVSGACGARYDLWLLAGEGRR
jgi:hypothetical protein